MIAEHDTTERLDNEEPAKRQRSSNASSNVDTEARRDCYDEVLEGHYNGPIQYSWLTTIHKISTRDPTFLRTEPPQALSPIQSLNRQLLQVKRRLWPAAVQCAQVIKSSSPQVEFSQARRNCNPLEPLGEGQAGGLNHMFMNRSAIKLANMDASMNFALTGGSIVGPFLFADLCGAPGGFSEYLMERCLYERTTNDCRGYGMSLEGANEHGRGTPWKLQHKCGSVDGIHTQYLVCKGADGTGDLYNWENVLSLQHDIKSDLYFSGITAEKVHVVVADGGFDAQRDSECQEQLAQKLVVCQVAAGLFLLKPGGTLIVKMFGFQTDVIRTVMRNLYEAFDQVMVLKPISSRPASSERYVVCTSFHGLPKDWDGPKWMGKMFLGDWSYRPCLMDANLRQLLEDCDRDLLTLNLKACFAILSCLERKTAACANSKMPWCPQLPAVNVDMYKHAWRLD